MPHDSPPLPSFVKLARARRLLAQGHCQESLAVALEALLQELDLLRHSLLALQTVAPSELTPPVPPGEAEPPQPDYYWLPPATPRLLH